MTDNEKYESGMSIRRAVLGDVNFGDDLRLDIAATLWVSEG